MSRFDVAFFGGLFLVIFLIAGGIIWAGLHYHDTWAESCAAAGGHIASHTSSGVGIGIGSKGGITPVLTSSRTDFCLSSDGRILGIR